MSDTERLLSSTNQEYQYRLSEEEESENRGPNVVYSERSTHLPGGNIVYLCFLLLGLGTLLPWNFFITAESFWQYKFRNTTESEKDWKERETELQRLYDPMQVSLSQLVNFAFLFINAIFSHLLSQRIRLVGSLLTMILLFSVTTILAKVNTDSWQLGLFVVTMVVIVCISGCGATCQGSTLGMAAIFPQRFMNAVMIGQALGGVFASLSRVVSVYLGADDVTSAFIYFLIAVFVMTLTLVEYLYVSRTTFFKHYSNSLSNLGSNEMKAVTNGRSFLMEHWKIFKKIWPLGVSVCMVFFVSLSVFPVICVRVISTSSNVIWAEKYFQPITTFLLFNVGDYLGRTIAEFILWPKIKSKFLYAIAVGRVVFIPLFLLCSHDPESTVPSVFLHDAWYIVFMTLFGTSNGYSCALLMMYAPRMVPENEGEKVGHMMATMVGLGLLLGSLASFAFALIS